MDYTPQSSGVTGTSQPPRLLDQVRQQCRLRHYSLRTEQAYAGWIKRFIVFHDKRHPRQMGAAEVEAFLSFLANQGQVSAATQNQALAALLFLYRHVLDTALPWMEDVVRAKRSRRLPVVLSPAEVQQLLSVIPDGTHDLMARLLYGTGMRLLEALRLRIKDVDMGRNEICVRSGKGNKDRRVPLPQSLRQRLQAQRERALAVHAGDLADGHGRTVLPFALARKYPHADSEPGWQYLFPSARLSTDPHSGHLARHHLSEEGLQRAIRSARLRAGIHKPVTCHTLRHCFATENPGQSGLYEVVTALLEAKLPPAVQTGSFGCTQRNQRCFSPGRVPLRPSATVVPCASRGPGRCGNSLHSNTPHLYPRPAAMLGTLYGSGRKAKALRQQTNVVRLAYLLKQ